MAKHIFILVFILTSFLSNGQMKKFDPYRALKNKNIYDIVEYSSIDSLNYIIVARKAKTSSPTSPIMYVQYIARYDQLTNEFKVTKLENEKSANYFRENNNYIKINSEIFRIRQNKNSSSLFLDKFENDNFTKSTQPFFSDDSLLYNLFPKFIKTENEFYFVVFDNENPNQTQCVIFEFDKSSLNLLNKTVIKSFPNQKDIEYRQIFLLNDEIGFYYKTFENGEFKYQIVHLRDQEIIKGEINQFNENESFILNNSLKKSKSNLYFYTLNLTKEEKILSVSISELSMDDLELVNVAEQVLSSETLILDYFPDLTNEHANTVTQSAYLRKNLFLFDMVPDKNGDVYFFTMSTIPSGSQTFYNDILITKLSNGEIEWTQKVRRGSLVDSNPTNLIEYSPKSPYPIINNTENEIELITLDCKPFFDSNGNYIPNLKNKIYINDGIIPVKISIDKKSGAITRSLIQE